MRKFILGVWIVLLLVIKSYSQEYYQQSNIEIKECLDNNKTYICKATNNIKLLPGFQYAPEIDNNMSLDIDRYLVLPPVDGYYGGVESVTDDETGGMVGSLPATFNVNNTGAAVYSLNLNLPSAIGTLMPKLALVYNNQSGNGLLGWSWELSGLSVISRVGQTEYHDGMITDVDFVNDRYAVDGNRLFAIDNAKYGAHGTVYKMEVDNMDKIISYTDGYNGPKYFVVWKSDGQKWEYGATEDSRMKAANLDKTIFRWSLNKISDRDGNAILFNYDTDNVTGESYIKSIEYTVNEKNGVEAAYKIVFKYEERRVDAWCGYVAGNPVTCKRLLENIYVQKKDTQKVLFDYSFEYDKPAYYGKHYFLHYRLKSIGLTVGDKKINSTKILWNDEKKHYANSQGYVIRELNKTMFTEVPFVGDFNGDGLSDVMTVPYKVQNTYTNDINGKVYLNEGDGTFDEKIMTSLPLSKNIDWIYVLDMNNDGKDDIVTYEYNYDYEIGDEVLLSLNVYLMQNETFVKKASYSYKDNVAITLGNFVSNNKNGLMVFTLGNIGKNKKKVEYISCVGESIVKKDVDNIEILKNSEFNHIAIDVTGDGVMELISMEENGSYINKLIYNPSNDSYNLKYCNYITSLKKDMYLFPNDFNGDGKTDVLSYDSKMYWNMHISKGDGFAEPISCTNTNLLRYVTLNTKDRYQCSLKGMMEPTVSIRTADFDGDGISDVAVFKNSGGNYYLQIGFLPYMKNDATCDFSNICRYYMPINYSHQTIHIGRFFPQENVSFISALSRNPYHLEKPYVVSLYPHSAMYSVERITDGLGNVRGFCYDCLMQKSNSNFYTLDGGDVGMDMKKMSVPLNALKADTMFSINDKTVVNTYEYNNAIIHAKGHGFLGFEKTIVKTIVGDKCIQKQVQESEYETMGKYCILLPSSLKIFHEDNQLIKEIAPKYMNYLCKSNPKIIMPLLIESQETEYDYGKPKEILKKIINKYDYQTDNMSDFSYDKAVRLVRSVIGHTDDLSDENVYDCPYREETVTEYDDDFSAWVINRPIMKKNIFIIEGEDEIGGVETFIYEDDNPLRITTLVKVPNINNDKSDSLMLNINYEYDRFGHVVQQAISSPSLKCNKILKYEYGEKYQYRYLTKTIDELGNEIICNYDNDYGILTQTIDYNNFVTENAKDPLGIDDAVRLPDGVQQIRSLRWSKGNEYAPENASYYRWEKSTGKAETMTFYHKNGSELRSVTFDINGNAVFRDKCYDDLGNVIKESLPYYPNDEMFFTSRKYDEYNRLIETTYPNDLISIVSYDGNNTIINTISKDGVERTKIDEFNVKGWLTNTTDIGGNKITYEYYSDGLLKSAMINNLDNTKITIKYDNNRKRTCIEDPNYGKVRYVNDALGNLTKVITNNGNVTEFEYDVLGRKIYRKDIDKKSNDEFVTRWIYNDENEKIGALKKVYNENHSIEYFYDDRLRIAATIETVDNLGYETKYTYDKANRISTITYPTGFTLLKTYSNTGYEQTCQDKDGETLLWKTIKTNACGCIEEYQLGNGMKTINTYNPKTLMLENIYTYKDDKTIQDVAYEYDGLGNMIGRSKKIGEYVEETFEYDKYDRLTKAYIGDNEMGKMSYDNIGNVLMKNIGDVKVLYDVEYGDKTPYTILEAKSDDANMFSGIKHKIEYSAADNIVKIICDDKIVDFEYGCEQQRISMNVDAGAKRYSKIYISNNEYVVQNDNLTLKNTYLIGPMGVFGVCSLNENGDKSISYIHKDNLESWEVVSGENGEVLQRLSFDAWGNMRDPDDWCSESSTNDIMFDRGYTGHEHLNDFGLINMNGRMYDPVMSMMISPDNNIQMPQMSQNFNRYSYCLNNPLKYNDPTGEWVESVLLGVVFGASNVVFNADKIDTFAEGLLSFGIGFVQGFLMEYTMGQSWYIQVGANTLTGAMKSGVNEMVSIGDGSFNFSGDDWNAVAKASCYGLGSSLVKSVFNSYVNPPTEDYVGDKLQYFFFGNEEVGYAVTALMAHGMGCWFSGQPMLSTMKFKDVGFDLGMLSIIATKMMRSYIYKSDFADDVVKQRAQEIKEQMMSDILSENPDHGDFEMRSELAYVDISAGRVYVSGNIFAMLPGEMIKEYPKPYIDEVVSFPFSYSLFRTLFFNK